MSVSVASSLALDQPVGNVAMQGASTAHLEQFLILAKTARGSAIVELIKQVLDSPHIFVFGELLDSPAIQELSDSPTHLPYLQLLRIFAYGKYRDFLDRRKDLPDLSAQAQTKLRQLTIVGLASAKKHIDYETLLKELDLADVRELEDLIIDVIYADIIRGKLDQKNKQLQVDSAIGRDVCPSETGDLLRVLSSWSSACEGVLTNIETQILRANQHKESNVRLKGQIETEVANIKKTLVKAQSDIDEAMDDSGGGGGGGGGGRAGSVESTGKGGEGSRKKGGGGGKGKGLRGASGGGGGSNTGGSGGGGGGGGKHKFW